MVVIQIIYMYHLLKAVNTKVENNFLKFIIIVESKMYGYWLISDDVCHVNQLETMT